MNSNYLCAPMTETPLEATFTRELLPHADALYGFNANLCQNRMDAHDLTQETLMKAWRSIESYQSGTNAKAWLFTIAKNQFINDYRKRKRRPVQLDMEDITRVQDNSSSNVTKSDLSEEMFQDSFNDEIYNALQTLTHDARAVILLDLEDFSYEEMAEMLEIQLGTVRSRLSRARKKLAIALQDYGSSQGYRIDIF